MTYEKFKDLVKADADKREQARREIADLMKSEAALDQEMRAAAETGDVDLYLAKSKEKEQLASILYVKRTFLDNAKLPVTEDDAKKVWEAYSSKYNKELRKALEDYAAIREKLLAMYSGLVQKQADACAMRENICNVIGVKNPDVAGFKMEYVPTRSGVDALGGISKNGVASIDPDLIYFVANMEIKAGKWLTPNATTPEAAEANTALKVIVQHRA